MKKVNRLNLTKLKVKSFVTSINPNGRKTVKGGSGPVPTDPVLCPSDFCEEPTGLGASCEWTMCPSHDPACGGGSGGGSPNQPLPKKNSVA